MNAEIIHTVYSFLYKAFGPQGWWPLLSHQEERGWTEEGYHPGVVYFPNRMEQAEIAIGAILTQNTAWANVRLALKNLFEAGLLSAEAIIETPMEMVAQVIKPSGYYRVKADRMFLVLRFIESLGDLTPNREELLKVKGIGPETADSIMLYAYSKPHFIVDAYTRRIFSRLGVITGKESYSSLAEIFESSLPKDCGLFQEYHALIVEQGKRYCSPKPRCKCCPLRSVCSTDSYPILIAKR